MFGFGKKQINPKLDENIELVLDEMLTVLPDAENYPELLTSLERLQKLKEPTSHSVVSKDTLVMVAGNILCVLVIVAYEQKHVMRSAAMTFVARLTNRAGRSTL